MLQVILMISGKIVKTFLVGDEKISDSKVYLQNAIENYTRALNTFHIGVSINVLEVVKGEKFDLL